MANVPQKMESAVQDKKVLEKKASTISYELIINFNQTFRAQALYPPNHPALAPIISNLYQSLQAILAHKESLNFAMSADKLLIEGKVLDISNGVYKDFAEFMNDREVATLSIEADLNLENLKLFLEVISAEPKAIKEGGGIVKLVNDKGLSQIELEKIDYEEIMEKEMASEDEEVENEEERQKKVVVNYLMGKVTTMDEENYDVLLRFTTEFPLFKGIVNTLIDDAKMPDGSPMVTAQSNIIVQSLQKINDILQVASPKRKKKIMENISKVVYEMEPNLRLELLLRPDNKEGEENVLDLITSSFSDEMITDMLSTLIISEATMTNRTTEVLKRLAPQKERRKRILPALQKDLEKKESHEGKDLSKLWKSVEGIFLADGQEKFVSDTYQDIIEKVSGRAAEDAMSPEDMKELTPYLHSVEKGKLEEQIEIMLVEFLNVERDPTEYAKLCATLSQKIEKYLEEGQYSRVLNIVEIFCLHANNSPDLPPSLQKEAEKILNNIGKADAIKKLVQRLIKADKNDAKLIEAVFKAIKGSTVPYLIDYLGEEKKLANRKKLLQMIAKQKILAVPYLIKRLNDKRWYLVRNLVLLLGELKDNKITKHLLSTLKHKDVRVRKETARALGKLSGRQSVQFLTNAIKDKDDKVRNVAIQSLANLKNKEGLHVLIEMISEYKNKKNSDNVKEAIRELGRIRSEKAVSALTGIFKKKTWFARKKNEEFRILAVEALGKIGTDQSINVLQSGIKERSQAIRETCQKILQNRKDKA